jgi:hypothetical protein
VAGRLNVTIPNLCYSRFADPVGLPRPWRQGLAAVLKELLA